MDLSTVHNGQLTGLSIALNIEETRLKFSRDGDTVDRPMLGPVDSLTPIIGFRFSFGARSCFFLLDSK